MDGIEKGLDDEIEGGKKVSDIVLDDREPPPQETAEEKMLLSNWPRVPNPRKRAILLSGAVPIPPASIRNILTPNTTAIIDLFLVPRLSKFKFA
jgi:hypothetical protein